MASSVERVFFSPWARGGRGSHGVCYPFNLERVYGRGEEGEGGLARPWYLLPIIIDFYGEPSPGRARAEGVPNRWKYPIYMRANLPSGMHMPSKRSVMCLAILRVTRSLIPESF